MTANLPVDSKIATSAESGVDVVLHRREVHMFPVTQEELVSLHSAGNYQTLDISLFSLCFGAFLTLVTLLLTSPPQADRVYYSFLIACILSFIGSIYFGIRARLAWKNAQTKLNQILNK